MFGKREKSKPTRTAGDLAQFGIFEVPETFDNMGTNFMDSDGGDDDLEAELAALTAGDDISKKPRRKAPRKPLSEANLNAIIAESMKDIHSDEEMSDGEDDPELLSELKMITGNDSSENVSPEKEENSVVAKTDQPKPTDDNTSKDKMIELLQERLKLYEIAEKKAKRENDLGRARRFGRGIKTLKGLLKDAQAGKSINEADIPLQLPPSAVVESTEKVPQSDEKPSAIVESIETVPKNDEEPSAIVESTETVPKNDEEPSAIVESTETVPKNDEEPSAIVQSTENNTNTLTESDAPSECVSTKTINVDTLKVLQSRQKEYQVAALAWKRAGNMKEALQCVKVAKQFDMVIAAVNAGETVDLSDMPPQPNTPGSEKAQPEIVNAASIVSPEKIQNEFQGQSAVEKSSAGAEAKPSGPENVELALKERLEVYRRAKTSAESEGNTSKVRRYGRICKQFEDALKLHARGKPVPLDELPIPPGFPPLSILTQASTPAPAAEKSEKEGTPSPLAPKLPQPEKKVSPSPKGPSPKGPSPKGSSPKGPSPKGPSPKGPSPVSPSTIQVARTQNRKMTRIEKQTALLQQRQHELKQAALNAKKDGDIELARDYLRQAKRIDPLISASQGGLPVDMNSIPISPLENSELNSQGITGQIDDSFLLVSKEDCLEEAKGTDENIYENLEAQLTKQMKRCLGMRDHSMASDDVLGYNKWVRLALGYKRDLDMLRVRKRDGLPPPQHHYETKTYAIVQSCSDLSDDKIEISIIKGVNYPKELDTYVTVEFPYCPDAFSANRTNTITGTCNPEYNFVMSPTTGIINRSSSKCQRAFKRHAVKCQVWSYGCSLNPILCCTDPRGFFAKDKLLGTVTAKLKPLETQCILHDSFPLMDGRKATGGKLELKIRLRNPILVKQVEQITDKWLKIDTDEF